MTDTTQGQDTAPEATPKAANILSIPVVKAKGSIEVNFDELPDEVYREILFQGAKQVLNRNMSKIVAAAYNDADAKKNGHADKEAHLKADAMKAAEKNLADMKASKIRLTGGAKAAKVSGAVKTEAMRIARNLVKDAIKTAGGKVSHYAASEITKAAKAYIEADPSIIAMAEKAIAERDSKKVAKVDLSALIKVDPEKVAAAEAKNAKNRKGGDKPPLSAKQAGIPTRSKGGAGATAH